MAELVSDASEFVCNDPESEFVCEAQTCQGPEPFNYDVQGFHFYTESSWNQRVLEDEDKIIGRKSVTSILGDRELYIDKTSLTSVAGDATYTYHSTRDTTVEGKQYERVQGGVPSSKSRASGG
jgi:hypothetical protein